MLPLADLERMVRSVYGAIATFLYTFGMVLAVFASAGLIPSVLEPGRIELLLSKPVSRTHILLGRYAGNVLVVPVSFRSQRPPPLKVSQGPRLASQVVAAQDRRALDATAS